MFECGNTVKYLFLIFGGASVLSITLIRLYELCYSISFMGAHRHAMDVGSNSLLNSFAAVPMLGADKAIYTDFRRQFHCCLGGWPQNAKTPPLRLCARAGAVLCENTVLS